jgi:hypothetical protein
MLRCFQTRTDNYICDTSWRTATSNAMSDLALRMRILTLNGAPRSRLREQIRRSGFKTCHTNQYDSEESRSTNEQVSLIKYLTSDVPQPATDSTTAKMQCRYRASFQGHLAYQISSPVKVTVRSLIAKAWLHWDLAMSSLPEEADSVAQEDCDSRIHGWTPACTAVLSAPSAEPKRELKPLRSLSRISRGVCLLLHPGDG